MEFRRQEVHHASVECMNTMAQAPFRGFYMSYYSNLQEAVHTVRLLPVPESALSGLIARSPPSLSLPLVKIQDQIAQCDFEKEFVFAIQIEQKAEENKGRVACMAASFIVSKFAVNYVKQAIQSHGGQSKMVSLEDYIKHVINSKA